MNKQLEVAKGIHPGLVLERELKRRKLKKGPFAISLKEYPQTLSAITKGKRGMNISLALKIEKALEMEEGYFMTLQLFHDIEKLKKKNRILKTPDISKIRPVVFWDTRIEKIDWENHKVSVIKRIFERGNEVEKEEIVRFYGKETVENILGK
ncbi:MAG: plasmid maintenance system antidote protein [Crocinitomicaceae bacterium]|nr:plasmid maintenance system antidote protein [Crocinitomicaceae bacterium]